MLDFPYKKNRAQILREEKSLTKQLNSLMNPSCNSTPKGAKVKMALLPPPGNGLLNNGRERFTKRVNGGGFNRKTWWLTKDPKKAGKLKQKSYLHEQKRRQL